MSDALCDLSIAEVGRMLRRGEVSSVGLTESCIERIGAVEGTLNAFITPTLDAALLAAREADGELRRGVDRGPLHGIPIGIKDLCATKGLRTTAGSKVLENWIPNEDATVVRKLREAGAVSLGKLNMHEFAYGTHSANPWYGPVRNPWDTECHPGGSSGGSGAAVAAGECFGAIGSDTGGSIRIPAALCGTVGLMPTYGLVSRAGVVPLAWSLDHLGPLARTVEDAAVFLNAIAGYDPADAASVHRDRFDAAASLGGDLRGVRIGVARSQFSGCDPAVAAVVDAAIALLRDLGASVKDVAIPTLDAGFRNIVLQCEASAYHADWLREHPEHYGQEVRALLLWGLTIPAHEYIDHLRLRRELTDEVSDVMETVDAIVMPTCEKEANRIADLKDGGYRYSVLTAPWDHTGQPVISVPCGFGPHGLPVGLSIAGRPFEEALICRVAHAYERAARWSGWRPP